MLGDDPAFSEKSGWSAVTTEPFFRPTTYEPITRNDQTLTPMSSTRTSDKAGDFRGSLAQPSVRYLMSQTHLLVLLIFIHVFFVFIWEYTHLSFFYIWDPCCRLVHICVFEVVEKKHHSYSTVSPRSPSSPLCCLAFSVAQDQTRDLYSKLESSKTSSWFCGRCMVAR